MRIWTSLMTLATVAALALALAAKAAPKCDYCGMLWDKSSTRIDAMITDGKDDHHHIFVSMGCMYSYISENYSAKAYPASFSMVDYNTFSTKSEQLIDGKAAFYLYGTDPLKGSMGPFVAAFATEKAAIVAKAKLGGEVLAFDAVKVKITSSDEGAGGGGCGCGGCGGSDGNGGNGENHH